LSGGEGGTGGGYQKRGLEAWAGRRPGVGGRGPGNETYGVGPGARGYWAAAYRSGIGPRVGGGGGEGGGLVFSNGCSRAPGKTAGGRGGKGVTRGRYTLGFSVPNFFLHGRTGLAIWGAPVGAGGAGKLAGDGIKNKRGKWEGGGQKPPGWPGPIPRGVGWEPGERAIQLAGIFRPSPGLLPKSPGLPGPGVGRGGGTLDDRGKKNRSWGGKGGPGGTQHTEAPFPGGFRRPPRCRPAVWGVLTKNGKGVCNVGRRPSICIGAGGRWKAGSGGDGPPRGSWRV